MFGSGGFGQQPAFGASSPAPAFGASFGTFGASQPAFGAASASAFGAPTSAPAFGASAPAFGASPGFGAASSPAGGLFGASAPAFGASAPAFGGASPFGAASSPSLFGASAPAFGQASAPAFGANTGSAFGSSAFGAKPAGFGGFGASPTPAFGGASAPAFGASTPGTFGQPASQPAFGAFGAQQSAPAFGATQSAFGGSSVFGAASSPAGSPFGAAAPAAGGGLFGASPGFGAGAAGATGTRVAPYTKTVERDTNTNTPTNGTFVAISAMPQYANKSLEELRWEDYQAGVKHAGAAPASPAQANPFGSPAAATAGSPFGLGAASQPSAFGATSTPAFGAASTPAFGGGGLFGAQSAAAPAFGATSTSVFGAPSSAPAFGGGGLFGASAAAPAFGATAAKPASTSSFSFTTTPSLFGASSASAFGASSAPSIFGAASSPAGGGLFGSAAASPSPFGATAGAFGAQSAASPFGSSLFGAAKPASSPSMFGGTSAPAFGSTTGGLFGASQPSMFGASNPGFNMAGSTPSLFSTGGSLYGASSSPSMFGGGTSGFGQPGTSFATQPFGMQQQQGMAMPGAQTAAPPTVNAAPYGAFPSLPTVPEPKVGITSRPARATSTTSSGGLRASPLVSLRATASGAGKLGAQQMSRPGSVSPLGSLGVVLSDTGATGTASAGNTPMGSTSGTPATGLKARSNPHQLFIRELPPSTQPASYGAAFSPLRTPAGTAAGGTPLAQDGSGAPYNPFTPLTTTNRRSADAGHETTANGRHADGSMDRHARDRHADGDAGPSSMRRAADDYSYLPSLGKLASEGYSYEPTTAQLHAMYQTDPDSLSKVSNFTVSRKDVGSVRWLKPVDVRGLKLQDIVIVKQGEIEVYYGASETLKPPVGQGLNQDAEIVLHNIYMTDKTTGEPVRDGPQLIRWEKHLRSTCAKLGARFVSYKPQGGIWKFEVEHFSKYGLMDLDDDEDTPAVPAAVAAAAPSITPQQQQGRSFGLSAMTTDLYDLEDGDDAAGMTPDGDLAGMDEGEGVVGMADGDVVGDEDGLVDSPPPALQHSLPTQLGMEPSQLMLLRETYFGSTSAAAAPTAGVTGDARRRRRRDQAPGRSGGNQFPAPAAGNELVLAGQDGNAPSTAIDLPGDVAGAVSGKPTRSAAARHTWRTAAPGIETSKLQPASADVTAVTAASVVGGFGSPTGLDLVVSSRGSPRPLGAVRAEGITGKQQHHMQNAGMSLGMGFRVGWGPDGKLIVPAPSSSQSIPGLGTYPVVMTRVNVEGRSTVSESASDQEISPDLLALRSRLRAALTVHVRHSGTVDVYAQDQILSGRDLVSQGESGRDGVAKQALPQWQLRCDSESLPELVSELVQAAEDPITVLKTAANVPGLAAGVDSSELQANLTNSVNDAQSQRETNHAVDTWKLLQVLYEARPQGSVISTVKREGNPYEILASSTNVSSTHATVTQQDFMDAMEVRSTAAGSSVPPYLDTAITRQTAVSRWLQKQALPAARAALTTAATPSQAVLHLLTAHHLAGAAAVAAATGDARLSTLLATGGLSADVQSAAAQQLRTWQALGMTDHIAPDRLQIYQLLAGQAMDMFRTLNLDWKQGLGLMLWYHSLSSSSSSVGASSKQGAHRNQPGSVVAAIKAYKHLTQSHQQVPPTIPPYMPRSAASRYGDLDLPQDLQYVLLDLWASHQEALVKAAEAAGERVDAVLPDGDLNALVAVTGASGLAASIPAEHRCLALVTDHDCNAQAVQGIPPALLETSGHSKNPCNAALPWSVMTVLQSMNVINHITDEALSHAMTHKDSHVEQQLDLQTTACMALVSQLLMAGNMAEWALFIALHLPDTPTPGGDDLMDGNAAGGNGGHASGSSSTVSFSGGLRGAVVKELLNRTAPEWAGHERKEAFLTQVLRIPQVLLAECKARLARSVGDLEACCSALLQAGSWDDAHQLLIMAVAPSMILDNRMQDLHALLVQLVPHQHACKHWNLGGHVYWSYLEAAQYMMTAQNLDERPNVQQLSDVADSVAEARKHVAACVNRIQVATPGNAAAAASDLRAYLKQLSALDKMGKGASDFLMMVMSGGDVNQNVSQALPEFVGACSTQSGSRLGAISLGAAQLTGSLLFAL